MYASANLCHSGKNWQLKEFECCDGDSLKALHCVYCQRWQKIHVVALTSITLVNVKCRTRRLIVNTAHSSILIVPIKLLLVVFTVVTFSIT